jgi:tagaturonate reductase
VGTGRFLRGFVGAFAHETTGAPRIVAVETTGTGMAARLEAQGCAYHLVVRGLDAGRRVERLTRVTSMVRARATRTAWDEVVAAACDPGLRAIVSNVTEAGYAIDDDPATPPGRGAWPATLLALLLARDAAGLPPVPVLPCELVERNGERLRALVREEAERRGTDRERIDRIDTRTPWGVTLVDRIVTTPAMPLPDGTTDPLAVAAEPFATWHVALAPDVPLPLVHPAIARVPDTAPFALRKIRILNGAHTALVARCRGTGIVLVREAMDDPAIAGWLDALLQDEIVPALGDRIEDGAAFARAVLERFRNPFLDHRLADIELHHATKLATRLVPTVADHRERLGREPRRLVALLAAEGVTA